MNGAIEERSENLLIDSENIGFIGEINPGNLRKFTLPSTVVFAEFELGNMDKIFGHRS